MAITAEKALLNNQSILQNFGLVEEIDEQAAEIISGGKKFTVKNNTNRFIYHRLDNSYYLIIPGQERKYTSDTGIIEFDADERFFHYQPKSMPLDETVKYEFKDDTSNPYDTNIVPVS
ncbi:hypothetical protein PN450_06100 [Dolichospermum lemmermannii CS-548]|uniref:hypothetical protein n=1 Tax=Dolichospermum lemmermannii TaxID=54295 RepID=UPI00232BD25E|nr:hypothetical protein [Dolichospermum lemmermannii]MDB9436385.1 hypothetical protein [Dolichospermum lemmermannii CS-548]